MPDLPEYDTPDTGWRDGKDTWRPGDEPIKLDSGLEAWELQPDETSAAFEQFAHYRDQGLSRTLRAVADWRLGRDRESWTVAELADPDTERRRHSSIYANVSKLSIKNRWKERVRAFDRHKDRLETQSRLRAQAEAVERAAKNHAIVSRNLVILGGKKLNRLGELAEKNPDLLDWSVAELLSVIKTGVSLERLVLGIDRQQLDPAHLSGEESPAPDRPALSLEAAKRIAREAAAEAREAMKDPPPPEEPPEDQTQDQTETTKPDAEVGE